ncbi:hypothetical protein B0H34DRAFT_678941 [Crassisporium funariophilum]|nr:hypothetical protein B0H34DRAFT_678941 [Crassisporium funariophilum]
MYQAMARTLNNISHYWVNPSPRICMHRSNRNRGTYSSNSRKVSQAKQHASFASTWMNNNLGLALALLSLKGVALNLVMFLNEEVWLLDGDLDLYFAFERLSLDLCFSSSGSSPALQTWYYLEDDPPAVSWFLVYSTTVRRQTMLGKKVQLEYSVSGEHLAKR